MSESIDELMARLRSEYLADVPARLSELSEGIAAVGRGEDGAAAALAGLFHKLAGSAGAYGYGDVSDRCRQIERWLVAGEGGAKETLPPLEAAIGEIEAAFTKAPTTPPIAP